MLSQRILSAAVFVPIVLAVIWFGDPWYSLVVVIVGILGVLEFYGLAAQAKRKPLTFFGLLWTLLFILNPHLEDPRITPLLITSAVVFSLTWLILRPKTESTFHDWVWTLAGIVYVGWMLSHFIQLRGLVHGQKWVLLAILSTFAADTSAYFVGKGLGKHPMVPAISPGKSWEGTAGGFLGGMAASLVLALLFNKLGLGLPIGYGQVLILGCLISLFALLGDLSESMLKRSTGVKDSGMLIPGHGGILDRLDSIVFTVAVVYYYVIWVVG